MGRIRCTRCAIDLDPGTERCPRCLRTSTVIEPGAPLRLPGLATSDPFVDAPPSHAGVRALVTLGTYAVTGPLTFVLIGHQAWLEARDLWLGACIAAMAFGTLPLRAAFSRPPEGLTAREAARHYALLQLAVFGMGVGLGVALVIASRLVTGVPAIFLGMFLFLLPLLTVPVLIAVLRGKRNVGDAVRELARGVGLAIAVVIGCAAIVAIRAAGTEPPKTIVIYENPKAFLDPLDLEGVVATARWEPDGRGFRTRQITADGGEFQRTLQKLVSEGMIRGVADVKADTQANGTIQLGLPARFDTPAQREEVRKEASQLTEVLAQTSSRAGSGAPIRIEFRFDLPGSR